MLAQTFTTLTWVMMAVVCLWYCPLIVRGKAKPVLATWIVGGATLGVGALARYIKSSHSFSRSDVTIYAGATEILVVLAVVFMTTYRQEGGKLKFNDIQKAVLLVTSYTGVFWIGTMVGDAGKVGAEITFWIMQGLLVTSYIPTAAKAIELRTAFDSIGNWGLITVACLCGLVPAVDSGSFHGILNSCRGILSAGFLFTLFLVFDRREGWRQLKSEVDANLGWLMGLWRARRASA